MHVNININVYYAIFSHQVVLEFGLLVCLTRNAAINVEMHRPKHHQFLIFTLLHSPSREYPEPQAILLIRI